MSLTKIGFLDFVSRDMDIMTFFRLFTLDSMLKSNTIGTIKLIHQISKIKLLICHEFDNSNNILLCSTMIL